MRLMTFRTEVVFGLFNHVIYWIKFFMGTVLVLLFFH